MMTCTLNTLPIESLEFIRTHLDSTSASALSQVDRYHHRCSEKSLYWRVRMAIDFPQKYAQEYRLLSCQISFARLYSVERTFAAYPQYDREAEEVANLTADNFKIQVILSPLLMGAAPAAIGLAVMGTAKAIHMAVQSGLLDEFQFTNIRQTWNRWYNGHPQNPN
jgi:hypothetical protein